MSWKKTSHKGVIWLCSSKVLTQPSTWLESQSLNTCRKQTATWGLE